MPRTGAGTYVLPEPAFVNGTAIDATPVNSDLSDIATALTQSIAKDGQTPMSGNLNANSHKITNLASGAAVGDAVQFGQFEQQLASPGYIGLPKSGGTGFILQMGRGTTNASGDATITFPRAYGTACIGVLLTPIWTIGSAAFMYMINAPSTTQSVVKCIQLSGGSGKATDFTWLAIGY